jgi:DNA-directed RNA polymerase subunit RPC12/RpoP
MIAKTSCQHCGEHIAFPSEGDGQTIECPHCKSETLLSIPPEETNHTVTCPCEHCFEAIGFDPNELVEENSRVVCPYCGRETKLFIPPPVVEANSSSPEGTNETRPADFLGTIEARRLEREAQTVKHLEEIASSVTIQSKQDTLKLVGDTITIQKRGWANALASGLNGDRTIQISSLTAVQMKPAGIMAGYILFSYAGSKPFMGGIWEATQDPDAFIFTSELNSEMAKFKAKVEQKMRDSKRPAIPSSSLADQLRSLAELKQQGILTADEFEVAKKKLLS